MTAPAGAAPPGSWAARLRQRFTPGSEVWQLPDFVRLWIGQTTSLTGSQVTAVALPLIAVDQLHAGPHAMGVLTAAGRLPYLLYLVAGVGVDRFRRRRLLLGTDIARGSLLLLLPVLSALHVLSLWTLGFVLCSVVALSVWFDTAYMSYLPLIVGRERLLSANTVMESSSSTTQIVGPGLGGLLVSVLTAPGAVLLDCLSFFFSAFWLGRITHPEPRPPAAPRPSLRQLAAEIGEGVGFVARHSILGPLALAIGLSNAAWAAELTLHVLYLVHAIGLPPWLIGITLAAAGPGALLGSALAGRVQRRFGVRGAVIGGLTVFALGTLLVPLAPHRPETLATLVLMLAAATMALGGQVCAVNVLTTRQLLAPEHLLGRVNSSFRFVGVGVTPLGALAGGLLGTALGLRPALFATVALMLLAALIPALSPVRHLRDLPTGPDAS